MIERIDETHSYYIDYFGIFKECQNNGYGTISMKNIIELFGNDGICFEIEQKDQTKPRTKRGFK